MFSQTAAHTAPAPGAKQRGKAARYWFWQTAAVLVALHAVWAAAACAIQAVVASLKGGSGGRVVVVVVGRGRVVVVVLGGFKVVVVVVFVLTVVDVVLDVTVVDVTPGLGVVVVVVGRSVVLVVDVEKVVVVTVARIGHLTRQAVKAVLHAWLSMNACPLHALAQVTSGEVAQPCWQVARAAWVLASHGAFLLAQLAAQVAALPGTKQFAIAVLNAVAHVEAAPHGLYAAMAFLTQAAVTLSSFGAGVVDVVPLARVTPPSRMRAAATVAAPPSL